MRMGGAGKSNKIVKDKVKAQSRQSARLFLQLSELGFSHPLTAGVCAPPPPLVPGEGHTRLREEGVGGPNSDEGTDTVVL
jgi:hypothetical protein